MIGFSGSGELLVENMGAIKVDAEALFDRLSFTHILQLLPLDDDLQRTFYAFEAIRGTWSVRELQRQMVMRQRFIALKDEAKAYFEDEMWLDAVRIYAELKKQGYVFPEAELKTVAAAYEKGRELCKARRKKAQDSGTAADVEKADADLRKLHVSYGIITGKIAK